jgi:1,4-dihydroxy-2-naphthoate octaprenyltransferase
MAADTVVPRAVWLEAARPRTLPASIAPVLVGTAASERVVLAAPVSWVRFLLALGVALSLQIAVNYANDYFDGVRGVDTHERVGPRRVVAAGLVAPGRMKVAIAVTLAVAGMLGFALAALAGWELLVVGVAAAAATLGYSGGPRPYASAGLGEVFVFVFFGLVATAGSAYVQDERLTALPVLAGVAMGALATALLVVNNLRDIPTDAVAGKRTLAVRLGEARTRALYVGLLAVSFAVVGAMAVLAGEGWLALPLLATPVFARAIMTVRSAPVGPDLVAPDLVGALERTAQGQLLFAALLVVGLLIREPLAGVVG